MTKGECDGRDGDSTAGSDPGAGAHEAQHARAGGAACRGDGVRRECSLRRRAPRSGRGTSRSCAASRALSGGRRAPRAGSRGSTAPDASRSRRGTRGRCPRRPRCRPSSPTATMRQSPGPQTPGTAAAAPPAAPQPRPRRERFVSNVPSSTPLAVRLAPTSGMPHAAVRINCKHCNLNQIHDSYRALAAFLRPLRDARGRLARTTVEFQPSRFMLRRRDPAAIHRSGSPATRAALAKPIHRARAPRRAVARATHPAPPEQVDVTLDPDVTCLLDWTIRSAIRRRARDDGIGARE